MATLGEQLIPTTGKWIWKEGDKPCLEFVSNNPTDRHERKRERRQKGGDFPGGTRRADKGAVSPNLGGRPFRGTVGGGKSPSNKQGGKQTEHTHIMLEDVKGVAYEKTLSDLEDVPKDFDYMFCTAQFDEFLICLLNYFQAFFEKRTHEQRPNPMNIEPSAAEKSRYAELCGTLSVAQRILGQAYCVLVLGVGLEHSHHMACGQSRVSNTYRDRDMYETLYLFCAFVVWITFRRREYEVVKVELNRILRSETFNPAIRVKNAPETDTLDDDAVPEVKEEKKITPAEYRRSTGKRPPIKSLVNQRSPALVSILPSPKEEAHWLFKKKLYETRNTDGGGNEEDLEEHMRKLNLDPKHFKIGIIGEAMSNYNPVTLTPKGADQEEEEAGDESARKESAVPASTSQGKSSQSQEDLGINRQITAASQVTTEVLSEDD